MSLSVIIVNWNGCEGLEKCLGSILRDSAGCRPEVIVIDNNSSDGSGTMVSEKYPGVRVLSNSGNAGFVQAVNQGLRQASGDYLLLLNNDTEVLPGSLSSLLNYLQENPDIGAAGGLLLNPDGTPQISYGFLPTVNSLPARYLLSHQTPEDLALLENLKRVEANVAEKSAKLGCIPEQWARPEGVGYVSAICQMTRRKVVEAVGCMDERFNLYFSDTDWCLRIKKTGWRVVYYPYCRVIHHTDTSFQTNGQQEDLFLKSMLLYINKHFGGEAAAGVSVLLKGIFANKINYFSRLAVNGDRPDLQVLVDYYGRLGKILQEA